MKNNSTTSVVVSLKKVIHRKQESLLLTFTYDDLVISILRRMGIFKWSKTLKGWYCSYNNDTIAKIEKDLRPMVVLQVEKESFEIWSSTKQIPSVWSL